MNHKQLTAFRAVMLSGSISEAARMIYVTQPAVSRQIKALEESLAMVLFERRKNRLYPTKEAHAFFREVRRHYIGMNNLKKAADQIRLMRRGRLQFTTMPAIASTIMPLILKRFLLKHSDVAINFSPHLSIEAVNQVSGQKFDLGLVMLPIDSKKISFGPCYQIDCQCILPKNHRLTNQTFITATDLHKEPFVVIGFENALVREKIDEAFKQVQSEPDERIETMLFFTAAQFVAEGLGVSIVDPFTAKTFSDHGLVVALPFQPSVPMQLGFITQVNQPITGLSKALIEVFEDYVFEQFSPKLLN